jgi:hypothetical protein
MKMNSQSRSFTKQVQVDLLALGDATLSRTIQQWMEASSSSEPSLDVPEDTRLSLGYTYALVEAQTFAYPHTNSTGTELAGSARWQAPSPGQLRTILTAMDVNLFAKHVITLAFQALHPVYPQWYEGTTFNAHLANYLRQMRGES